MISFPTYLFLIPYAIVFVLVAVLSVFTIWHFIRYSETTVVAFLITFVYLAGTAYILFFTYGAAKDVDWQRPITVSGEVFTADPEGFRL